MKHCSKCDTTKPLTEFHNHKRSKDGKYYACKDCKKKDDKSSYERNWGSRRRRAKEYYSENKEKIRKAQKKYKEENKDIVYAASRKWASENPEKMLEYKRKYREANRETIRESGREYSRRNLNKGRLTASRRRAKARGLPNTLTPEEVESLLELFNFECAICGNPYEHLDHFIPIASGHGGTTLENSVPMCGFCNVSKGAKNPFEWANTLDESKRERFDSLVLYLTDINGIESAEDYESHVHQCFSKRN